MRLMRRRPVPYPLVLGVVALFGCGSYLDDGDDETTSVYLNPTAELRPHFEEAIERWEAAGVRAGTVRLVERSGTAAYVDELDGFSGYTEIWRSGKGVDRIRIEHMTAQVFVHEIGCHALTRKGNGVHIESGMCSSHVLDPATPIDAA